MDKKIHKEKILLALLPFWTPLIPPLGIACLKGFLRRHGYHVTAADGSVEGFDGIYNAYFNLLKEYIPQENWGNFYNIGNDVLRNHMMAHFNYTDEAEYCELVKIIVYRTFFHDLLRDQVSALNKVVADFYSRLESYFLDLLEREKPDILGLSVFNATLPASMFAFKLAKEKFPHIKTVMGGGVFADQLNTDSPNFEYFLEKTPYIDKIIVGEGENLFLKLLSGELPESQRVFGLKDIDWQTLSLDSTPLPDFSDFNIPAYPNMASYVSRSCPFQCSFCSETVQWGKYRKKDAKQIIRELMELYEKYRCQLFLMGDSLLNPVATDLAAELVKEKIPVYWDGYLRADQPVCDPENTLLWRRGGFYRARLGVESGSPHVLELMGKKLNPQQIKDAVSSLASAGIKTTTYWVVGHPGETEEDFQQTLDLIEELKDDIYEAECNPFNFYMAGQVKSHHWKAESRLLYPESARRMLIAQTWTLECEPSREDIYKRIRRFVRHCGRLGIPNPYSLADIHKADHRWKHLKKNAAPSLMDFKKEGIVIDECKHITGLFQAQNKIQHDDDWGF